jgi:hypothetical protein
MPDERKKYLKNSIDDLKLQIADLKEIGTTSILESMTSGDDILPGLNMETQVYDYDKDIELIKIEAEDTIDCISSLYLNNKMMSNKNINKLIKNDATEISDIKFSLSCAKRGLINCMKQIDVGSTDPEIHNAINSYQKEIRESNKMIHELLNKMKDFYKNLRDELKVDNEINIGKEIKNKEDDLQLVDKNSFNDIIDMYKKDPTLLK